MHFTFQTLGHSVANSRRIARQCRIWWLVVSSRLRSTVSSKVRQLTSFARLGMRFNIRSSSLSRWSPGKLSKSNLGSPYRKRTSSLFDWFLIENWSNLIWIQPGALELIIWLILDWTLIRFGIDWWNLIRRRLYYIQQEPLLYTIGRLILYNRKP